MHGASRRAQELHSEDLGPTLLDRAQHRGPWSIRCEPETVDLSIRLAHGVERAPEATRWDLHGLIAAGRVLARIGGMIA